MCIMSEKVPSQGSAALVIREQDFDYAFYANDVERFSGYMMLVQKTARSILLADILNLKECDSGFLKELVDQVLPEPVAKGGTRGAFSFGLGVAGVVEAGIVGDWALVTGEAYAVADSLRLFASLGVPVPPVNTAQIRALGQEGVSAVIAVPAPGVEKTGYNPFGYKYKPVSRDFVDVPGSIESHDGGVPRYGETVDRTLKFVYGSRTVNGGVAARLYANLSDEVDGLIRPSSFVGIRLGRGGKNGVVRIATSDLENTKISEHGTWRIPHVLAPKSDYYVE